MIDGLAAALIAGIRDVSSGGSPPYKLVAASGAAINIAGQTRRLRR
ncbi:MAG TPA: hypothetical protein VHB99_01935 [Pirellulales bacterium]|nr:hypothetical protein [Pirellulales bacterium]